MKDSQGSKQRTLRFFLLTSLDQKLQKDNRFFQNASRIYLTEIHRNHSNKFTTNMKNRIQYQNIQNTITVQLISNKNQF